MTAHQGGKKFNKVVRSTGASSPLGPDGVPYQLYMSAPDVSRHAISVETNESSLEEVHVSYERGR